MKSEGIEAFGKLLLRLSVGGLMLGHGIYKLTHGLGGIEKMLLAHDLPKWLAFGVPVGEIIAPMLIILGIWSRLAGLVLTVNMATAIYLAYGWAAFHFNANGGLEGELALLFLFGGLAIFCVGSGKFAVSGGNGTWD
jgi:putative oxidoreductase